MKIKEFNEKLKELRSIIMKQDQLDKSKKLILNLHAMVHISEMSGVNYTTFEDELWDNLDEYTFRNSINEKGRTIAYGIWHSSRIEDITMNILVANQSQVFNEKWKKKINSSIIDTGNELDKQGILQFSKFINMNELKNYRLEVGKRTIEIIKSLTSNDMKRKFTKEHLQKIIDIGAVANVESANWLIDFWGKKTVAGIILMPVTRHNTIHLSECFRAKK